MRVRTLMLAVMVATLSAHAPAFPGVCVGTDHSPRFVHATQVTVMRHARLSIVTVMANYEGPLSPFALILPVPADVTAADTRTLRQGILRRVEQTSAPRLFTFYEQDPCGPIPLEHQWEEHLEARGHGPLTPPDLPALDRRSNLSNLISAPTKPSFKGSENEFRYHVLTPTDVEALDVWLTERGYRAAPGALAALRPYLARGLSLLVAEVASNHVEITGTNRVQLGGIRYVTAEPWTTLPITLGLQHSAGAQDLLVFVFDRAQRFAVRGPSDTLPPTNLRVFSETSIDVSSLYNAVFDRVTARRTNAAVTEYAWSTAGCGQPCPDAPLALDELMTLGGDVIEARTTTARERAGESPTQGRRDRRNFAQQLAELPPARRAQVELERKAAMKELGRREALKARQTYVLSRIHYRYGKDARDLELAPAEPARGGTGVPDGPAGELPVTATVEPGDNQFQTRFIAFKFWNADVTCAAPIRFRWGKRWASEVRASRALPLAMDLPRAPRSEKLLDEVLKTELPELAPLRARAPSLPAGVTKREGPRAGNDAGRCAIGKAPDANGAIAFVVFGALGAALRWRRTTRKAAVCSAFE